MAKKKENINEEVTLISVNPEIPRPRLKKFIIKNFRCIGSKPVEIELDDIVVLVGTNNVGKSSILRAYELVMLHGSKGCELKIEDFPNSIIDETNLPEIEIQTIVFDNSPGEQWILTENNEKLVRERWIWKSIGQPKREGFNVIEDKWSDNVPWGAPNVAKSRRPEPHRVDAFDNPITQANSIKEILMAVLNERVKNLKNPETKNGGNENKQLNDYQKLLEEVKNLQKRIVEESKTEIERVQNELSNLVNKIFPHYQIQFDAKPEDDLEKTINLFKANPELFMGHKDGYFSTIDRQGSGARRTLLWTALKFISENNQKQNSNENRPHVLLLDEPEICLHPSAVRDACNVLYNLPQNGNWQVMVTTHSPAFIDFSRDNTTIVRVDRDSEGNIQGSTVFRPEKAKLDDDDKSLLKMLNICDPHVAEFFFGTKTIIVEGDTEYTAFKYVIANKPDDYKDIHIIRARGKATIATLCKILNHFGSSYSVLHDSDTQKIKTKNGLMKNPAWTNNQKILDAVNLKPDFCDVRLIASIPNFEKAYFGVEVGSEKPYNALNQIKTNIDKFNEIELLLNALIDHSKPLPNNCVEWKSLAELDNLVTS